MNEFPLYPELPDEGKQEAQNLVDSFKESLKKAANEVIGVLYTDVIPHIETDSWANYRNSLMDGFKDYSNRKIQGEYDFKEIRQSILKEHYAEIINDLNTDLVNENFKLKEQIEMMHRRKYE